MQNFGKNAVRPITVQMDKDSINRQTVLKEIQAIENISKKTQDQMILIMKKQESLSNQQLERMQEVSENYLDQMQDQETLSRKKLEILNEQIIKNTQKGLSILNQEVTNVSKKLKTQIDDTFSIMDDTVINLKQSVEYTDFKEKLKTALPIAIFASLISLLIFNFVLLK